MLAPRTILDMVAAHSPMVAHNAELLDIFQGNLLPYIDAALRKQMSIQSYEQAVFRTMPINVLPKVIDKLTNIYQTTVIREVVNGDDADQELLAWYVEKMKLNKMMNSGNEIFNLCKSCLLYPYAVDGLPKLRVILNDRFLVYSDNPAEPEKPTHVIIYYGKKNGRCIYWVWSAQEFVVIDSDGKIDFGEMEKLGYPDGVNPFGVLPFIYVNESEYRLVPVPDTDVLPVTKVIPIMLTDLNLASMFQAFSMVYGIDLDDENIVFAPNAFLRFKTNPDGGSKPSIGTIKPEVDFAQVLGLVQAQFSMWLGTKGIRASSVGQLTGDNFASGLSKIIDEMDTYEARQKQTVAFMEAEQSLWELLSVTLIPYWIRNGQIENTGMFTQGSSVKTIFAVQMPMQQRGQVVRDLRDEYAAGFTTRKRAIQALNPQYTSAEVDKLLSDIDVEQNAGADEVAPIEPAAAPELLPEIA